METTMLDVAPSGLPPALARVAGLDPSFGPPARGEIILVIDTA